MSTNAKFWTVGPRGGLVRIKLLPDQSLTHHRRFWNGEGTSWEAATWTHEGSHIREQWASGGRDCDGQHSENGERIAPLDRLAAIPLMGGILRPDWQQARPDECRDVFAEAAGY